MSTYFRLNRYCSELDRTADELIAFDDLPVRQRTWRAETHTRLTARRYVEDCAAFARWCRRSGRAALVRKPERAAQLFLEFAQHCEETNGWGIGRIGYVMTALNTWYVTRDLPRADSRALRTYLAALRKQHVRVRATPVRPEQVKAMCRRAMTGYEPVRAARDIALILYAFTSAKRPSEVCALRWEDVSSAPDGRGIRIRIPRSKGDPLRDGQYVTITRAREDLYCPVRALERWRNRSGVDEGFVFRSVRSGNVGTDRPLSHTAYQNIVQEYLVAVGLTGKCSGYSLRRGYASSAYAYGASTEEIQQHLRHKHRATTQIYIEQEPIPFERSITGVLLS